MNESGGNQAVQRLAGIELTQPRLFHQLGHVTFTVEEFHDQFLFGRELDVGR